MNQFPRAPELSIPLGPFRIFTKILGDIRNFVFAGEKLLSLSTFHNSVPKSTNFTSRYCSLTKVQNMHLDYIPSHITNVPLICMLCRALVQLRFTVHYRPHLLFQACLHIENPSFPYKTNKRRTLTSTTMYTVKKG
jgi:hypothetical protein